MKPDFLLIEKIVSKLKISNAQFFLVKIRIICFQNELPGFCMILVFNERSFLIQNLNKMLKISPASNA